MILTEGLWNRKFVGDFADGSNKFIAGKKVDEYLSAAGGSADGLTSSAKQPAFVEKYTHGVVKWWNLELKDKTPEWTAERTGLSAADIRKVAIGFAKAAPKAMCWVGGGPAMQVRGGYSSMAAHALNGLVGSVDNVGGTLQANKEYTGKIQPTVVAGILDLTDWDFAQDGPVQLDGEWEFYWNQLHEPSAFIAGPSKKSDQIIVPESWNSTKSIDRKLPAHGFATYRMVIKTKNIDRYFLIFFS